MSPKFLKYLWPLVIMLMLPRAIATETGDSIVVFPNSTMDGRRSYTTEKTDVLSRDRIEKASATSLNEALDRMAGIDSQDYCVNCGAKRISINGLRGDHTSVLIDGIPLFSAVSSVYGYDAISMLSVEEIEVRRGTGGALLNPEAIGGSINIVTITPKETSSRVSVLTGSHQTRTYEAIHNHVLDGHKISVGGEFNSQEPWDVDQNHFAESPFKKRYSGFLKQSVNLSDSTQWTTRLSHADMEIMGGNTAGRRLDSPIVIQASDSDFDGGDVRNSYNGDFTKISEYVRVKRTDATSKVTSILDSENTIESKIGAALYDQESYYMHAFDYKTKNTTAYADLKWIRKISENQLGVLGTSYRGEFQRSDSKVMYEKNGVAKDNFNYGAHSLFAQHEILLPKGLEISTALRMEKLRAQWLELGKIDREVLSPRVLLKWQHNDHLSQQLAYGQGYRMPLTSIESAHGAYDGFIVDVTELEKSHSLVYSVSYNTPTYYFTPSAHYTRLENMSYPLDPVVAHSGPLRFVSDSEDHKIFVYDVLAGVRPVPSWLLEVGWETYDYEDSYKKKLPTAAIEERINFRSEVEKSGFTFIVAGTWVAGRDLGKYHQYPNHYNTSDGLLGVSNQKKQKAPAFFVWDTSLAKKIKGFEITVGVQNLFDYTQTKEGDSPAMWHLHGNHTHLDNRHVWGPNRGREYYLKAAYSF